MYGRIYTKEERAFFQAFVPGHSHKEIRDTFETEFGWPIKLTQVKAYIKNNKLNTGRTGRFEKGFVPHNKGQTGVCAPGCKQTWFKKGHEPTNHKPVGSERIDNKDGYVLIKTKEPRTWELKHRVIWEERHGPIPEGKCLIFLNGDKTDVRLENLKLIDRKVHVRMNQSGLRFDDSDSTRAAVGVAELLSAIGEAKRSRKRPAARTVRNRDISIKKGEENESRKKSKYYHAGVGQ